MTENYEYKVGGSLGENAPSYVVRKADEDLYQNLKAGEFCYVFNSRQMGKTSLIVRTMNKLLSEGYACSCLDFSVGGSRYIKSEQWYAGIVYKLITYFKLANPSDFFRNWWKEKSNITPVGRLEEFIETVLLASIKSNIVIFIDEIDSILSLGFPTDDFFALIRNCYEKRNFNCEYQRLTFALVGVATPGDLIGDKRRTSFNIGRAIQLDGFQESEIEPLAKGFSGLVENPLALMKEILNWTGGQPFLTQKVCKLLRDEEISKLLRDEEISNGQMLGYIIKSKIIENWEANDEPEHLKTIRDRILLGEQVAGRFLGLYQQILRSGYIAADDSIEHMRFCLIGLVVKQQNRIKVYNKVYQSVFNLNWVEQELGKLRPYGENFQVWVNSNYKDESRLLRGKALQDALSWAKDKSLSNQDTRYLAASQEIEKRELTEALATKEEESRILAAANETLSQAQHKYKLAQWKSQRQIKFGCAFLAVSIVGAIFASVFAFNAQKEHQNALRATQLEQTGINLLREISSGKAGLESLSEAMQTARELTTLAKDKQSLADYPAYTPIFNLQNILLNIRERNRFDGHKDIVRRVVFSPDGKTLVSASTDKTIKLWNVTTGKVISTFSTDQDLVLSVALSSDGKILASASLDKTIKLWNVTTGKVISTFSGHQSPVLSMAFSPDGTTLASASADKTIKLWNITTGKVISTFSGHQSPVLRVAFSPDGKTLASASDDKTIKLWNITTGKVIATFSGHQDIVNSMAFSPDGKTLASGSADNTIKLWHITTGKLISTFSRHQSRVNSVAFSPDGKTLASASADETIKLWNVTTGKLISTFRGHQHFVLWVAFSPDGKTLASASADKTIKLWNITTDKVIPNFSGHQNQVKSLAFSPDGKTLVSASADKTIKLWNITTGKLISTFSGHQYQVNSVAFSPDGKTLASASDDKTIKLWNVTTGKLISTFNGHQDRVNSVAFSPVSSSEGSAAIGNPQGFGKTLASASDDKTIKLWNITTGKVISTFSGHQSRISSVAFSPDGKTLATASWDKTIKLWNVTTGKVISTFSGHQDRVNSVAFSLDGKTLAIGEKTIKLHNTSTGKLISTFSGHQSRVNSVAFSPDGKTLASASDDKTIKLWNITTGKLISTFSGHQGIVWSVAFSPVSGSEGSAAIATPHGFSKILASASGDKTIKLWSLDLDDLLARGCDYLEEYLASRPKKRKELCPEQ